MNKIYLEKTSSLDDLNGLQTEIREGGKITAGEIESISRENTEDFWRVRVKLKNTKQKLSAGSGIEDIGVFEGEFYVRINPIVLIDEKYDCIHFDLVSGSLDIYRKKPDSHCTWR